MATPLRAQLPLLAAARFSARSLQNALSANLLRGSPSATPNTSSPFAPFLHRHRPVLELLTVRSNDLLLQRSARSLVTSARPPPDAASPTTRRAVRASALATTTGHFRASFGTSQRYYSSNPQPKNRLAPVSGSGGLGTTRVPNEILMRCTVLDAKGAVKTISGLFKKSELCTEHRLEPRDLRKIDSRVPNLVPTILARKAGFLVNILHIRALVKADAVLLFDSYGSTDTHLHSAFVYNLEHNLRVPSTLRYEFRALESILASVLDALQSELSLLRGLVSSLLEALDANIDREKLRLLLQYSRKLGGFLSRARGVGGAVMEVLESDEDMGAMYLTDAREGMPRDEDSDHDELELLLESFGKQVEEVVAETQNMVANVQNTQEIVELILDSNRNALLALDLKTGIATLGISTGTMWVGLFGMNLKSHFEEDPHAFFVSSTVAFVAALVIIGIGLRRLARLRRVGLGIGAQPGPDFALASLKHSGHARSRSMGQESSAWSGLYPNPPPSYVDVTGHSGAEEAAEGGPLAGPMSAASKAEFYGAHTGAHSAGMGAKWQRRRRWRPFGSGRDD